VTNAETAVIAWLWFFGPLVIAVALVLTAIVLLVQAVRKENPIRARFAIYAAFGVFFSVIASPLGNMLVYGSDQHFRAMHLAEEMQARQIVGWSVARVRDEYGEPDRIAMDKDTTEWVYNGSPWFMTPWDFVVVKIEHGKVTRTYLDIF
jgi:energy-converting hydrogenase Eha subunit A